MASEPTREGVAANERREAPSATTTCKCGAEIYTGPRDLVINGEVIAEKCVVDLNANHRDFVLHWQAEHPNEPMPERIW